MDLAVYEYDPATFRVTNAMKADFNEFGYIILRNVMSKEEIQKLTTVLETSTDIDKCSFKRQDGHGNWINHCAWNVPGDDLTGVISRSEKIAGFAEQLLGGGVYHYHTKLMMKGANTKGRFHWHQDYGYWYNYGNLFPDMLTTYMAVDRCYMGNGCLQILRGSHKCGRVDHQYAGGQMAIDDDLVAEIAKVCPHMYVELNPGDVLYFNCNLLHCNDPNTSNDRRWTFLTAFNLNSNSPTKAHHHPAYHPLTKVPNSRIMEVEAKFDPVGKDFVKPDLDEKGEILTGFTRDHKAAILPFH